MSVNSVCYRKISTTVNESVLSEKVLRHHNKESFTDNANRKDTVYTTKNLNVSNDVKWQVNDKINFYEVNRREVYQKINKMLGGR